MSELTTVSFESGICSLELFRVLFSYLHSSVTLYISGFFLFYLIFLGLLFMAMQDEVAIIDSNVEEETVVHQDFGLAVQEVKHCLQLSGDSFPKICTDIESATSRPGIKAVFR